MDPSEALFEVAWAILGDILDPPSNNKTAAWSRQLPKYKKRPRNTATRKEKRRDKKRYKLRKSKLKRYRMQNKRKLSEYQKHYNKKPNLHKVRGRV